MFHSLYSSWIVQNCDAFYVSLDIIIEQESVLYIVIKEETFLSRQNLQYLGTYLFVLLNENGRYVLILMGEANSARQMSMN